jgi:osmotically-inducible protein OsmY
MAERYEDRYRYGRYGRDRDYADDRGYMDRAGDEVRSWFGDDEAERRRREDEQRDREREREWRRRSSEWNRYEPTAWGGPSYGGYRSYEASPGYRERESIGSRDRDWSGSRDRDWTGYRDREWDERNRGSYGADRSRDWTYDRQRDWSGYDRSQESPSRWSIDEGRTEFTRYPSRGFGAGYATETSQRGRFWGRGPKGYQRSDDRINEDVCDRLTEADIDAENIQVSVSNGEVTLTGAVRNRWDKRQAEDLVEDVSGVKEVHNNLRVTRDTTMTGTAQAPTQSTQSTTAGATKRS